MSTEVRSMAELEALVLRAARGAGLPLGWAEDLADAIRFLAHGPGTDGALRALADCLETQAGPARIEGQHIQAEHPVAAAVTAFDMVLADLGPVTFDHATHPVSCALICAAMVSADRDLALEGNALSLSAPAKRPVPGVGPVEIASDVLERLGALAALTYVPETEASRRAGAGSGSASDND